MPHKLFQLSDGYLAFETHGEGIPLIFIHGFSFDMRTWDAQVDQLSRHFCVIRYDLRGFGKSSLPAGPYSHVKDLLALIDYLSLPSPVLVGLSLGANVALNYAFDYPAAVRALVLASSGLPGFQWSELRPPDEVAVVARNHGIEHARQFWLDHPLFTSTRRSSAAFARVRRMVNDYSGWHWGNTNPTPQIAVVDRLPNCTIPTLVMSGEQDVLGYRQIAAKLSHDMPRATIMTFPGVGHVINEEAPAKFSEAVLNFVRNIATPPPDTLR